MLLLVPKSVCAASFSFRSGNFVTQAEVDIGPYTTVARRPTHDVIFRVEKLRY
jgi:hypothetical protein